MVGPPPPPKKRIFGHGPPICLQEADNVTCKQRGNFGLSMSECENRFTESKYFMVQSYRLQSNMPNNSGEQSISASHGQSKMDESYE